MFKLHVHICSLLDFFQILLYYFEYDTIQYKQLSSIILYSVYTNLHSLHFSGGNYGSKYQLNPYTEFNTFIHVSRCRFLTNQWLQTQLSNQYQGFENHVATRTFIYFQQQVLSVYGCRRKNGNLSVLCPGFTITKLFPDSIDWCIFLPLYMNSFPFISQYIRFQPKERYVHYVALLSMEWKIVQISRDFRDKHSWLRMTLQYNCASLYR